MEERAGVKLSSWLEIVSDGDVLLTPYVPKGITGYDDDDDDEYHSIHTVTFLNISALKGTSSGSTDTFCEQGHQNTCLDVNIRLQSSVLYVT